MDNRDSDPESTPAHGEGDGRVLDLTSEPFHPAVPLDGGTGSGGPDTGFRAKPYNSEETRENTRGDLARGLLWLLTFVVGGVLVFIGLGRLDGTVLTQSIFPSLIALAGTALGFYFGSQNPKAVDSSTGTSTGNGASPGGAPSGKGKSAGQQKTIG